LGKKQIQISKRVFLQFLLALSSLSIFPRAITAASLRSKVRSMRVSSGAGTTRIVLDLDGVTEHTLFTLQNPQRVVVDLTNATMPTPLVVPKLTGTLIENVRYAVRGINGLRMVFDLRADATPRSFFLTPNQNNPSFRLVVDLERKKNARQDTKPVKTEKIKKKRNIVVAIDAGHGGRDPGAVGKKGTREKDIVLSIARKLEAILKRQKGITPYLTRRSDIFLPLRERIRRARSHKADLFISIHADAARRRKAQGSSVYILSQRGASSEAARWLAKRENDADLVGGVNLDDKDDLLKSVLLDLSQSATIEASLSFAEVMLDSLKRVGKVHSKRVEQAGFVVLKSPDIPSILVETAFISNPREEKKLRSKAFQKKIAKAIHSGIIKYYKANPSSGVKLS